MARELTKRQAEILDYIISMVQEKGYPPTIAEIGTQFGIASTNGVNDHLIALERKGYIERSSKARSIQVTKMGLMRLRGARREALPLVGRIAAGQPVLAVENVEEQITVPAQLARENAYCLRVQGDSMIEDGILDGDIIIVDQGAPVRQGAIVVALFDDEATVKHYFLHDDTVELRPANRLMKPMFFPADRVRVQGVVVGLQRILN